METFRPYTEEQVKKLQGSFLEEYSLAKRTAQRFRRDLNSKPYINALGALTGNQAMQMAKAGLSAIYLSGWQVAADNNDSGQMYPDQSLYAVNSAPLLVRKINNCLKRADQIEHSEGKVTIDWFLPIIADCEAGFGGPLNAFEITKAMIEAGAAGVHFEDQLSSAKKCGHLGGKVLIPASHFVKNLIAARLAADVYEVPTVIIARTDADSAKLLTSDIDKNDKPFLTGKRTEEGYYEITGGLDMAITRGLAYAPFADLLWCETSRPNLDEAKKFADAIHNLYPSKMLAYNCLSKDTQFITNKGVKSFNDFKNNDYVNVLTHTGKWQNAIIKNYGKQFLNRIVLGKGKKNVREHEIFATKEHRWLLVNGNYTTDLKVGDSILRAKQQEEFDFDNAAPFEKLYWCYGYVYGDGTKWKKNGEYKGTLVRLCGRDKHYKNRFEEVGFKTSTNLSLNGDFYAYTGSYLKTLPNIDKDDIDLIKAFTVGWLDADGAKITNKNGKRYKSIQITGIENIEFLKSILPICGFYITRIEDYTEQITNYGKRNDVTKRINISYNKDKYNSEWTVNHIEVNYKKEEVWCLEVENDHSFVFPNGVVTGNCSPSFNWKKYLNEKQIFNFQRELGAMGYKFQFITLAGFHILNQSMFDLALEYSKRDMEAYIELQEKEFDLQHDGYTATKHQREVGVGYFDLVAETIGSKLTALKESTETDQFHA